MVSRELPVAMTIALRKYTVSRFLWSAIITIHLLNVPAVWFRYSPDTSVAEKIYMILFSVSSEGKIPTWYSACTLVFCSLLLAIIAADNYQKRRSYSLHWSGLALLFALLSLDEATSLHEMTTLPLQSFLNTSGPLLFAWVIPALVFVIAFGLLYLRFLIFLAPQTRRLFLLSGFVYVFGALGMEMIGSAYVSSHGRDLTYGILATMEEILEMSGIALFIFSLIDYLEEQTATVSFRLQP